MLGKEVLSDAKAPDPPERQGQGDKLEVGRQKVPRQRQRSRLGNRETGLDRSQLGGQRSGSTPHTPTGTHTHGDRARTWVLGTHKEEAPDLGPPHLLGLGRGLGREAGAGTFRDPAVSVMRAHQLGRQVSPWAVRTSRPCARASHPTLTLETQRPGSPPPPELGTQTPSLLPL